MSGDFTANAKLLLQRHYLTLINDTLPAHFTQPVQHNHCFARIILDWTFKDCWYYHLHTNAPAYRQLSEAQLQAAIERMQQWLTAPSLLIADNNASLHYRRQRQ